jgi:lipoprotein-anchoring transpeptidase ErfK/SrfK
MERARPRAVAAALVALAGMKAGSAEAMLPAPAGEAAEPGNPIVAVDRSVVAHAAPGGPAAGRIGPRTEFGSPTRLAVTGARGRWLAVSTERLRTAWIKRSSAIRLLATRYEVVVSLHARRLELRDGVRTLLRTRVAIGRPGSPTPTGRFGITDKLAGSRYGRYYGCCILALSTIQTHLPQGWTGGARVALHGTDAPGTLGEAASAGCVRLEDRSLRTLMRRLPLGTPVIIKR